MLIKEPMCIGEFINNEIKSIKSLSYNLAGLTTGFKDLDCRFRLNPSELTVIGARIAMGKTTLLSNIILHCVMNENVPVILFSLSTGKKSIMRRFVCSMASVNLYDLKTGNINNEDEAGITNALSRLANTKLYIDDSGDVSVSEIHRYCNELKNKYGLGLIAIDGLQNIRHDENSRNEIEQMAMELKSMSLSLDVPIVITSQLNRLCENRADHRPQISMDFGDYGVIAKVADTVMFMYRDEYYNPDSKHSGECELIVAKGEIATGTMILKYISEYAKFCDNVL